MIDDPIRRQSELLPMIRLGGSWIWLVALVLTAWWSRRLYGPRAMALAAWLFALSPNLIAHAGLATMEFPIVAAATGMFFLFWTFLHRRDRRWLWASAVVAGLAFSFKYTAILFPPILAAAWAVDEWSRRSGQSSLRVLRRVALGMSAYVAIMLAANVVLTGFALLPLSRSKGDHPSIATRFGSRFEPRITRLYETPIPQDWVGFATQFHHQMSGGSSFLLGERRMAGWRHYYFVAMAVKVPLALWLLVLARLFMAWRARRDSSDVRDGILLLSIGLFLAIAAAGSSRNYGLRYLLPMAPLAIVWVSAVAEWKKSYEMARLSSAATRLVYRGLIGSGLAGQLLAVVSIHPHELTYFNALAGGSAGGRHILSDSNLDWGQGLRSLARLQRTSTEYRDLTLYYFGDTEPAHYGVDGKSYIVNAVADNSELPGIHSVRTRYLAVSASLQWGPWGPAGFFDDLSEIAPVWMTDDTTIAIYRKSDLAAGALAARGGTGRSMGQDRPQRDQ